MDAAGVSLKEDDAATVNTKMSTWALVLYIMQLSVLPLHFWKLLWRTLNGGSTGPFRSKGVAAAEAVTRLWADTLPPALSSIYSALSPTNIVLHDLPTLWGYAVEANKLITRVIGTAETRLVAARMTSDLPVTIGATGASELWNANFFWVPTPNDELAKLGGNAITADLGHWGVKWGPGRQFGVDDNDLTYADAQAIFVLSAYPTEPKWWRAGNNIALDLKTHFLNELIDEKINSAAGQMTKGDILAASGDASFKQTLSHYLGDIVRFIEGNFFADISPQTMERTINALPQFVNNVVRPPKTPFASPVFSSDELLGLQSSIAKWRAEQAKLGRSTDLAEFGGIEQGFFPALLAAAPAIAGLLGGGGGGAGGGMLSGLKGILGKMPLGRMLFGGGEKPAEAPATAGAAPGFSGELISGLLKLLLSGLGKGGIEDGIADVPDSAPCPSSETGGLLDFLNPFAQAKKLLKLGRSAFKGVRLGKKKKKKKGKRQADVETSERDPDYVDAMQIRDRRDEDATDDDMSSISRADRMRAIDEARREEEAAERFEQRMAAIQRRQAVYNDVAKIDRMSELYEEDEGSDADNPLLSDMYEGQ